jgi:hypothetical protein
MQSSKEGNAMGRHRQTLLHTEAHICAVVFNFMFVSMYLHKTVEIANDIL